MLTPEQKNYLIAFCKKHFVRTYDVRLTIAAEMANDVVDKMKTDASLSFEAAVQRVYESYGVTGFSKLIDGEEKNIFKQQQKMRWELVKNFFTVKNTFVLFVAIAAFIILALQFKAEEVLYVLTVLGVVLMIISYKSASKRKKIFSKQKLELSNTSDAKTRSNFALYAFPTLMLVMIQLVFKLDREISILGLIFLFVIIVYGIIDVVVTDKYVKKIYQTMSSKYPEAFM